VRAAKASLVRSDPGTIQFGDDPSGFMYAERTAGEIVSWDASNGEAKTIATDLDDFLVRLVCGPDADQFAGLNGRINWQSRM
jgi:hypothetical protein